MDSQPIFNAAKVTAQTLKNYPLTDDVKRAVIDSVNSQRDAGNFMAMFKLLDHNGNQLTNCEQYQLVQWLEHLGFTTSGFSISSDILGIFWGPLAAPDSEPRKVAD